VHHFFFALLRALIVPAVMVFAAAAHADGVLGDAAIVEHVVGGRFEVLKGLDAASRDGDPVAMYWWGLLQDGCTVQPCKDEDTRDLWLRSAKAGFFRARISLWGGARTQADMDELMAEIGAPRTSVERLAWAHMLVLSSGGGDESIKKQAADTIRAVAATEPTMMSMYLEVAELTYARDRTSPTRRASVLRTLLAAGFPLSTLVAEQLRRHQMVHERMRYQQTLASALSGAHAAAISLCESVDVIEGYTKLPPDLLPLCRDALARGQLGVLRVLLTHYLQSHEAALAAPYAALCTSLPVNCGEALSGYLEVALGRGPAWFEAEAIAKIARGVSASSVKAPLHVLRQGVSKRVAIVESTRTCLARQYEPGTQSFGDSPGCPWGRPLVMPTVPQPLPRSPP
jgi:hypothetical protein